MIISTWLLIIAHNKTHKNDNKYLVINLFFFLSFFPFNYLLIKQANIEKHNTNNKHTDIN